MQLSAIATSAAANPQDCAQYYSSLEVILRMRGGLEGAEAASRAAIRLDPRHAQSHSNLGVILLGRGDWGGAKDSFLAALAADPDYAHARMNLDELRRASGYVLYEEVAALVAAARATS